MKKLFLIFLFLIVEQSFANDSTSKSSFFSNIEFGLKGGLFLPVSSSNYEFRDDGTQKDPSIDYFLGIVLGVSAIYGIDDDFSVRTELQYSTFKYQIDKIGYFRNENINVAEELIEMPILFRVNLDKQYPLQTRSSTGISLGPVIGYKLTNVMHYSLNRENSDYYNKLNNYKLALYLAVDITSKSYIVDFRYKYALLNDLNENNNLIKSNDKSAYVRFHSIQFNLTYLLSDFFK